MMNLAEYRRHAKARDFCLGGAGRERRHPQQGRLVQRTARSRTYLDSGNASELSRSSRLISRCVAGSAGRSSLGPTSARQSLPRNKFPDAASGLVDAELARSLRKRALIREPLLP